MTVYLNTRSHFSLGESLLTPTEIVQEAKSRGATAVALTDTMRITGMVEFIEACRKESIRPIIGARLTVVDELTKDRDSKKTNKPYYLRVLIQNEAGYKAVLALLSKAFDADHFYEVPRLLLSDVAELGKAGAGAVTCTLGDFYGAHTAGKARQVVETLRVASVPVVSEIVPVPTAHFARLAFEAFQLQKDMGVPVIIASPFFYKSADQAGSLDLLKAIAGNQQIEWSTKHFWREFVALDNTQLVSRIAKTSDLMTALFGTDSPTWRRWWVDCFQETKRFPDTVTFDWKKEAPSLPVLVTDEFGELVRQCQQGVKAKLTREVFGYKPTDLTPYYERLKYELSVLKKLKFESYFLLVSKIVNWSKEQGIRVGPGRGSVGGSLVAYLMGITDIDPIRFNLLFERFINPDRIDLPDADLDFMSTRREEIISYIKQEFGDEYVAAVANYNTMGAAGVLKDICSKIEFKGATFAFGKLVPKEHGQSLSLEEAITQVPELMKFATENPEIIFHARNLEDRMRAYGKHAAGIVVAKDRISERAVVERRDGNAIVNWDKNLVEHFGLVKMDILGLSNLDMIDIAVRHIKRTHGKLIDIQGIPLDDPKVLDAFSRGETVGVFQFESAGMRRLLKDLATVTPLTFEDITAATALYRPGPMDSGLMAQFVKIKQGSLAVSYPHPSMEDALKDTYGVMVYQEEVMQVSRDFAGFTLVEADHLRKAMGKKDKDKMKTFRDKFVAGAVSKHGVTEEFATEIYEQIEKFAGYGFNKSHASAYSLISYICMWLKVYYPAEFFCGLLSMDKADSRNSALMDMSRLGIKLIPPDINDSSDVFEPLNRDTILMPFSVVKGIGESPTKAILKARNEPCEIKDKHGVVTKVRSGRFKSIEDFELRVAKNKCHSGHRKLLDKVGAFSRIDPTQLPSTDASRRRDQVELIEGLILDTVIVEREGLTLDTFTVPRLSELINAYRACDKCELSGLCHPRVWIKGPARVMIVMDAPSLKEEGADEMGHGSYTTSLFEALDQIGLKQEDVYITSLIKSPKPETTKMWSNKTLSECPIWLDAEIELLKPPVIVTLGSFAFKHFVTDGSKPNDSIGRVIYDKGRDANILVGFNPSQIYFDSSKQEILNDIFAKIPNLLIE